ncbi:MAG: SLC13 family permease [Bacteroidota bacterium]
MASSLPADIIFLGGLTLYVITGIVSPEQALVGFSNQGMLTVGALYIVAAGLRETGTIQYIMSILMGRPKKLVTAQMRIMAPVMGMSAFLNNTPVVASFIPALQDWAQKNQFAPSKLMIPLSYAAIFGGTCTLIGTSTNLVVNGLLIEETGQSLNLFDPAWLGLPVAVIGTIYLLIFGRKLLPDRHSGFETFADPREYTIEMLVDKSGPLVGKTVEEAGLRHLPGVFLVEIYRNKQIMPAVSPDEKLQSGDRLIFAGIVESIVELRQINGLSSATDQMFKLDTPRRERRLVEAVVSNTNPMIGKTIKTGRFRNRYEAVVLAVARNGERIKEKVGDIVLRTGDTLLLEAHPTFEDRYRNSRDFYLVSGIADSKPLNHDRAWIALTILIVMVALAGFNIMSMFQASLIAAAGVLLTGCVSINDARRQVDMSVLLVIAASLGLGKGLEVTGAAEYLAANLLELSSTNITLALASTYLVTWVLTELITNNAAAVLVFPIIMSLTASLGVAWEPFIMTVLVAASASFSTPIGYQTNLMVYGPGGYHFTDYIRVGLPLNIAVGIMTVILAPMVWSI